ncbi:MAG: glutaminase A [Nannocystis sp.]|nr:glutaminase A [Nannocystis sp.]
MSENHTNQPEKKSKARTNPQAPAAGAAKIAAVSTSEGAAPSAERDAREYRLFMSLDLDNSGAILREDIEQAFISEGINLDDYRLRETAQALRRIPRGTPIDYETFCAIIRPSILLVERTLQGNVIIRDFEGFCGDIQRLYDAVLPNTSGRVAQYIPQLARVDPEQLAVAVCTIDGQRFAVGDAGVDFCVQSCCKPINYCAALELRGEAFVHAHVGREPSGRSFNEIALNDAGKPHNPLINAGAIMCSALLRQPDEVYLADRFDHIMAQWQALTGGERAKFNNAVYLSEKTTADRNFALAYFMRENKAFPPGTDLEETLEFYFQCCSIEVNAAQMATVAATLANGGICPTSGERVFSTKTVQNCLSLMYSCGMYDFSGEFAFAIGLPAKSGVGGALMIVVPNVMGICTWSPRLDKMGNSGRGIDFCKRLVEAFNFHNYDTLTGHTSKKDPRISRVQAKAESVNELIWAASKGDVGAIQRMDVRGIPLDGADYDGRTALHLAAAEGRHRLVAWLLEHGVSASPRDRWGNTPLDDAHQQRHPAVIAALERVGAVRGDSVAPLTVEPPVPDAVQATQKESEMINELIWAASMGELRAIQRMIARGADLEGADYDRRTPLHLAAAEGHVAIVKFLIDQRVGLSPRDRWGFCPLDDATRHDHPAVAALLREHGGLSGATLV